jgi:glycosyltransferase involved in cell wall biosynthesis
MHGTAIPLRISVAAITFKRPQGLARLLSALEKQERHPARPYELTALVIDNDPGGSAREVAERFKNSPAMKLIYVHEIRQGIPIARNAALEAVPPGDDFMCFIDDDEWPSEHWIDAFLELRARAGGDCFYGPVSPCFPDQRPEWFVKSGFFAEWKYRDAGQLDFAASNNVMISMPFVRDRKLRFDNRMRFTGGSDYLFFRQAVELGMVVRWAQRALVYEEIPLSRMTWPWILQRHYRIGNTFSISERIIGNRYNLVRRFFIGIARIGLGVATLPALIFSPASGMRAIGHVFRWTGMLVGLLGHRHEEYSPAALAREGRGSSAPTASG